MHFFHNTDFPRSFENPSLVDPVEKPAVGVSPGKHRNDHKTEDSTERYTARVGKHVCTDVLCHIVLYLFAN